MLTLIMALQGTEGALLLFPISAVLTGVAFPTLIPRQCLRNYFIMKMVGVLNLLPTTGSSYLKKYICRTNVCCTEFKSTEGTFEVIDFIPRHKTSDQNYIAPAEIFRYIKYIPGKPSYK
jgi:hypothetical protein